MPKVGAHVSAAISLDLAFDRAQEIGAEAIQIFISPPQKWAQTAHEQEEIDNFREKQQQTGIGPNFIHSTYLINLGTANPELLKKSIDWLSYSMKTAEKLGVTGVIFHPGSHKGAGFDQALGQIVAGISKVLKFSRGGSEEGSSRVDRSGLVRPEDARGIPRRQDPEKTTFLILETSAGAGDSIGDSFSELGKILKAVNSPRLKICLDTQHVFASGYDVKTPLGLEKMVEEFDQQIGLNNLVAIHANDSKVEFKSGKDRHANIGEGFIGKDGFELIINHPAFLNLPFMLEVPGFMETGPDKANIELLKSLVKRRG